MSWIEIEISEQSSDRGLEVDREYGMTSYSRIIASARVNTGRGNPERSDQWFAQETDTFAAE